MKRALIRFARVVGAAALAAGIQTAINQVGSFPVSPFLLPTLTAALLALDKLCRDNGIY